MGQNDRAYNRKESKANEATEKRRRRSHSLTSGESADWSGVDGTLIAKAVAAIAKLGGALRLGYTRDCGAYAIGIYGDGEPFTEYVPPSDDVEEYLKGLIDDYSDK